MRENSELSLGEWIVAIRKKLAWILGIAALALISTWAYCLIVPAEYGYSAILKLGQYTRPVQLQVHTFLPAEEVRDLLMFQFSKAASKARGENAYLKEAGVVRDIVNSLRLETRGADLESAKALVVKIHRVVEEKQRPYLESSIKFQRSRLRVLDRELERSRLFSQRLQDVFGKSKDAGTLLSLQLQASGLADQEKRYELEKSDIEFAISPELTHEPKILEERPLSSSPVYPPKGTFLTLALVLGLMGGGFVAGLAHLATRAGLK